MRAGFSRHEAAGGVVLLGVAVVAVAWANLDPSSYEALRSLLAGIVGLTLLAASRGRS